MTKILKLFIISFLAAAIPAWGQGYTISPINADAVLKTENIRSNMDVIREKGVKFMEPFLPINDEKSMAKRLKAALGDEGLRDSDIDGAVREAYRELDRYKRDVMEQGQLIIDRARREGRHIILLAGRPYHIDPEIHHGIPDMIASYGLAVLTDSRILSIPGA